MATCYLASFCPHQPTGDGSKQWPAWSPESRHSHPRSLPHHLYKQPWLLFLFLFVIFLKKDSVFVIESRYFKNTSKGYNQVMKMLNIIKDDTKIFTKIFTKAILKIIDLHTEHHTV